MKNIDTFTKNIILVFIGTSLANFLNLLYQLLIAHKFIPSDFAAFNSLLAIFTVVSSPLTTIQMAVTKYLAEFNAQNKIAKVKFLLSDLFKKTSCMAIFTLLIFAFFSIYITQKLKISSVYPGYILAVLLASTWINPVFSGGVLGLELFGWLVSASLFTGVLKLVLTAIFILLGYNISGALGALLASSLVGLVILYFPIRRFIALKVVKEDIEYKAVLLYLLPVAISYFCFICLVSLDMVLVKYYFNLQDAGIYSLAQMLGKVFLFLPLAISTVMFPRASGLNAKSMDTTPTLQRSLLYATILCIVSILVYNLFPVFILKILTGKALPESITLGRLFSISMSLFALLYILITYFLSQKDLRFIRYLVLFTFLQYFAIFFFHKNLIQIQIILCINAILLFFIHFALAFKDVK